MRFAIVLLLVKFLPGLVHGYSGLQLESCAYRKWGRDGTVKLLVVAGIHENEFGRCGRVSRAATPAVVALDWMLAKLNGDLGSSNPYIPGVTIGYDLYDNCDNADMTTDLLYSGSDAGQVMDCTGVNGNQPDYVAAIALTNTESTQVVSRITHPTAVFHPMTSPEIPDVNNIIHTSASFKYEAEAIVNFLKHYQWNMVVVVHTADEYGRKSSSAFSDIAIQSGLCVALIAEAKDTDTIPSLHSTMLKMINQTVAVVFFGDQTDADTFVFDVEKQKRPFGAQILWIFSSLINRKPSINSADSMFMISDQELEFDDFKQYFRDVTNNVTNSPVSDLCSMHAYLYGRDGYSTTHLVHIVDSLLSVAHVIKQTNCAVTNTCTADTLRDIVVSSSFTVNDSFNGSHLPQSYLAASREIKFSSDGYQEIEKLIVKDGHGEIGYYSDQDGFTSLKSFPTLSSACNSLCEGCRDQQEIKYSYLHGDVLILGLFSLRTYGDTPFICGEYRGTCTDTLSVSAFMEYILTQRAAEGVLYGGIALDDCYNALNTTHLLSELFSKNKIIRNPYTGAAIDFDNVVAIVGALSSPVSVVVADFATSIGLPMISYSASSPELDDRNRYPYFFRTVPSDTLQVKGMLSMLQHIGVTHVGAVYIDDTYGRTGILKLQTEAAVRQICVEKPFAVTQDISDNEIRRLIDSLYEQEVRVVIHFSIESTAERLLELMPGSDPTRSPLIFIASEAWGRNQNVLEAQLGKNAIGTVVFNIANRLESNEAFKEYLTNMNVNENKHNRWVDKLFEDINKCDLLTSFEKIHTVNGNPNICSSNFNPVLDPDMVESHANGQRVVHIAHALRAVLEGYRLFCSGAVAGSCPAAVRHNPAGFASQIAGVTQNGERLFDTDHNGNIGYTIYNIQLIENAESFSFNYIQVGSFSVDGRLSLVQEPVFYNDFQKNISIRDVYETDCLRYEVTCSQVCRKQTTSLPPVTSTPTSTAQTQTNEESSTMLVTTIVFAVLLGILAIALVLVIVILLRKSPKKDEQNFAPSHRSDSFDKTYDVLSGHYNVPHMSSGHHNGRRYDGSQLSINSQPITYTDIRHRSQPDLRFNHIRQMSSPDTFQMATMTLPKYNKSPNSKRLKSNHTGGMQRSSATPKTPHSAPGVSTLERYRKTNSDQKFRYPSIQDDSRYTNPSNEIDTGSLNTRRSRAGTDPEASRPPSHAVDSYITPTSEEPCDTGSDHKITYLTAQDLVQESSEDEEESAENVLCSNDTDTGYMSANPSLGNGELNDQSLLEQFSYNPNLTSPSDTEVSKINFPNSPTSPSNQSPLTEIPDVLRHGRYDTDDNVFII